MAKDIATGLGLTIIVFLIAARVPVFGFFGALLLPLPTLFYRVKLGRRAGIVIPGCAVAFFLGLSDGLSPDVFFLIDLLVIGFIVAELFERRLSIEATVIGAAGVALAMGALALLMAANITGQGIGSLVTGYVARNLEASLDLYRAMGMPEENVRTILASLDRIHYVLVRLLPAMAVTGTLAAVWTSVLLGRAALIRRRLQAPDFGELSRWKAPEALVWVAIGAGLLLLVPSVPLKLTGANLLMMLMAVYFFQGIAIVTYFLDRKALPRPFRIFLYSLIAIQQILLLLVVGLGFFDMWFNFRRLETPSAPVERRGGEQ